MLRLKDLYTKHEVLIITDSSSNDIVGTLINDYEVQQYADVRDLRIANGFVVSVSQRLIIPASLKKANQLDGYDGYPAYVINTITPIMPAGDTIELIHYSPITINSSVESSINSSVGDGTSDSQQHTVGSSTAVTSSYDVQVNLSQGGGVSGGYSHATTTTSEQSRTGGSETHLDESLANSDAMSVKEWGAYLSIDVAKQAPSWTWTQEFPWNTVVYRDTTAQQTVTLPTFVKNRLFLVQSDKSIIACPPSAISLRGLTFLSKARWAYFPRDADALTFQHDLTYATASHLVASGTTTTTTTIAEKAITLSSPTSTLDRLSARALAPISSSRQSALLSFVPSQFRASNAASAIIAPASNDIMVEATNFEAVSGPDSSYEADVTKTAATLKVCFKIIDSDENYSLYLKHWKTAETGCTLSIRVNDNSTSIVRHVDAKESESGSDNVLRLFLRNLDYSSTDFYDYLVLGLNTVVITVSSDDSSQVARCGYAIRALAVG